jgi:hypothetical protein
MNAGEVILVKEVIIQEDSIHLRLPVFEGKVAGTKMMISAFDGAHALVFQVRERENTTRN